MTPILEKKGEKRKKNNFFFKNGMMDEPETQ
jgi:hypothetical protein